jgi:hypothetical protein
VGTGLVGGRRVHAFGEPPSSGAIPLAPERQAKNVLEIFLFGGLSPYESFYNTTDGEAEGTHWYQFYDSGDVDLALEACGFGAGPLLTPFGEDGAGKQVNLGPFAKPLTERPDILARTRIAVTSHGAEPHEVAIPLAIAGRQPGHPAMAGIGSHVQRFFTEREGPGVRPYSYVLRSPSAIQMELLRASIATGLHPGAARPYLLSVSDAGAIELLKRQALGDHRDAFDALVNANIARYDDRIRFAGEGEPLRSARLDDLRATSLAKGRAPALQSILEERFFTPSPAEVCGQEVSAHPTAASLQLAAHLLTQESPARHVTVIDGGFVPVSTSAGGYDSHDDNCLIQSQNLFSTLRALADIVAEPGTRAPGKIDLDETMIVINTEFGRTPFEQGRKGRGHWPFAYPVLFIGGPVRTAGIHGIVAPDATAEVFATPTENRIAVLLAMGIYPFDTESYNVGDVRGAADEQDAIEAVLAMQLGEA